MIKSIRYAKIPMPIRIDSAIDISFLSLVAMIR